MSPAVSLTSQTLEPVQAFAKVPDQTWQNVSVSLADDSWSATYSGSAITAPTAKVSENGTDLPESDYSLNYYDPAGDKITDPSTGIVDAGTYTIVAVSKEKGTSGEAGYVAGDQISGSITFVVKSAEVTPGASGTVAVANLDQLTDTDKENIAKVVQVKFGNKLLTLATEEVEGDYTVTVGGVSGGKAECTVTLTNSNYTFANSQATATVYVAVEADEPEVTTIDLTTAYLALSYDGEVLSNNGFVISIPSGSDVAAVEGEYADGIQVTVNGKQLTVDEDYTISFKDGEMTIAAKDGGNCTGSRVIKYTLSYEFGDDDVDLVNSADTELTYTAKALVPDITVIDPATKQPIEDYTVEYQVEGEDGEYTTMTGEPTNVGNYKIVVTYKGQQGVVGFQITEAALGDVAEITPLEPVTYTGKDIEVSALTVVATFGEGDAAYTKTLKAGEDYEIVESDEAIKNVGSYEITIEGINNYTGTETTTLKVVPADLADVKEVTLTNADELVITKSVNAVTPEFDVTYNGVKLATPADYTLNPKTLTNTGDSVMVTLEGTGNFEGSKETTVKVLRGIDFAEAVGATGTKLPEQVWDEGDWQKPAIQLTYNGNKLPAEAYTVEYGENNVAGTDTGIVTVIGNPAYGWGGSQEYTYDIKGTPATIEVESVSNEVTYNGTVQDPSEFIKFNVVSTEDGEEITVDPKDYKATVKTDAEFKDTGTYAFEISLAAGQYEVSTYYGTIEIKKADLQDLDLRATADQYLINNETGEAEPAFEITLNGEPYTLTEDTEYTLAATGDSALNKTGEYKGTVSGVGNFEGEVEVAFDIATDINSLTVSEIAPVIYDGEEQTPKFTVTDAEGNEVPAAEGEDDAVVENYTVSWKNNINAGTAQLVLTGKGEYGGTKTVDFTIEKAPATLEFEAPTATYTGSALKPEPVVTLKSEVATLTSGKDFTATYGYTNNTNAGTATITVNASGEAANNYAFEAVTKDWTIEAASIADAVYAGETQVAVGKQPAIKFTLGGKELKEGTDYKVVAAPIVSKAGKATLTIEGINNFAGTKTVTITVGSSTPVNPDNPQPGTDAGWKKNATGWWYVNANGSYPTNTWQAINGAWYHFDARGYMSTGWVNDGGTWYYCNKAGEGVEGKMAQGWRYIDGRWFYFAANGAMATGWLNDGGTYYLLNTQHDGTYGAMLTGWQRVDHATGAPTTANSWYYLNPVGGALATDTWVGNYHVDSTGYWNYSR